MTDKLSPEDLAVWWQAYRAALGGLAANLPNAAPVKILVSDASHIADAALAQYKTRQEPKS